MPFLGMTVAGAAPSSATLTVGNTKNCPAEYTTISAAVAAASSGDTISVCAGIFDETVDVTTPDLTFVGAEANVPAKSRYNFNDESQVISPTGGFILSSAADDTTINGFTIENAGNASNNDDAVEAFQGSSGLALVDNIVRNNNNGVNLQNPDASEPAVISGNRFATNNAGGVGNGQSGTSVFISNGPANSTSITGNQFFSDSQTAINFAGSSSTPSVGLVVESNTSTNDSTFVVATASTNALIEGNTVTVNGTVPGGSGTGILDFGGNTGLRIAHNVMKSNATNASAIHLTADVGAVSTDSTVTDNTVAGWANGINVDSGYTSAYVSGNKVSANATAGITVASGASGNDITYNAVSKDPAPAADCIDGSTGYLTAGTANTWMHDTAADGTVTPAGICAVPPS